MELVGLPFILGWALVTCFTKDFESLAVVTILMIILSLTGQVPML